MIESLLTAAQVAERLGITRQRVHAFIKAGRLPAAKIGPVWVIEPAALAAFQRLPSGRPRRAVKPSESL